MKQSGLSYQVSITDNPTTKCIKCQKRIENTHYIYSWRGISGSACQPCGDEIHSIGFYLLDKAVDIFKNNGIITGTVKEKFGRFEIYSYPDTKKKQRMVEEMEEFYCRAYPEITWEFV